MRDRRRQGEARPRRGRSPDRHPRRPRVREGSGEGRPAHRPRRPGARRRDAHPGQAGADRAVLRRRLPLRPLGGQPAADGLHERAQHGRRHPRLAGGGLPHRVGRLTPMALSRRETLARLGFGAAFLSALALAPRSLLGSLLFEPEGEPVPAVPPPPNPFVRDGRALVAIVHGTDPAEMLREGLALLGGAGLLGLAGRRVLLKPNVVNSPTPPSTTAPEVVAAVGRLAKAAGASELV